MTILSDLFLSARATTRGQFFRVTTSPPRQYRKRSLCRAVPWALRCGGPTGRRESREGTLAPEVSTRL